MLLWLLHRLASAWPALAGSSRLDALAKITFRGSLAALTGFLLAIFLGPRRYPLAQGPIPRADQERLGRASPAAPGQSLDADHGRPVPHRRTARQRRRLWRPYNRCLQAALLLAFGLAAVGAVDDLTKLFGRADGISARAKLLGQVLVAGAAAGLVYQHHATLADGLQCRLPLAGTSFSLGPWFIPWSVLVIVGSSNAVNLTDGLDGLAGGCLLFAAAAMTLIAYACGHAELAEYLHLPRIPGAGEMTVLAGGMIGGLLGFLWFNCHPAQVFLGDTGSLPLGGLLGLLAVISRQEILLLLDRRGVRGRDAQRDPPGRLLQMAPPEDLPMCPAAPSLPIPRLARDRGSSCGSGSPPRCAAWLGLATLKLGVHEPPERHLNEKVATRASIDLAR